MGNKGIIKLPDGELRVMMVNIPEFQSRLSGTD